MPATLSSQLILSATGYLLKAWLALGTRSVKVEGLPILLEALREKGDVKGKGKANQNGSESLTELLGRRGVITGV
jgi:hypothetical protein